MNNISKNQFITFLFSIPAIWGFSGLFLYSDANKELALFTLILFLFSIPYLGFHKIKENLYQRKISWLLIAMSIFALISKITHGYSSSEIRVLISLSLYSVIITNNSLILLKKNLSLLSFLGCFTSFAYCFYEAIILDTHRAFWGINAIPYSTFTASVTITSLWFIFNHTQKTIKIISSIAVVLGVSAIIISQTRGSLLAISIAFIYLIYSSHFKINIIKSSIPMIIIALILSYLNFDKIEQRYEQTKNEYTNIMNGNLDTSIGYRLQMWKAGFELAKTPTLLGLGKNHIEAKQKLYEEHKISKESVSWGHYHNQYITTLIKNGIVGFILLVLFFFIPIDYAKKNKECHSSIAQVGILVLIIYLVSSFTDIPLTQAVTLAFYGLFMLIVTLGDKAKNID